MNKLTVGAVLAITSCFAMGQACSEADFTVDGSLDFFDVSAFLTAFSAGCP